MADVFSKRKRSEVMARIKGRGNLTTEVRLAGMFRAHGIIGWRRHQAVFRVRPDFVFRRVRVAVFVDGRFWHGCTACRGGRIPKSNRPYWKRKIEGNRLRDKVQAARLRRAGWKVVRIWEHDLKKPDRKMTRLKGVLGLK